jgi:hypothetical protein
VLHIHIIKKKYQKKLSWYLMLFFSGSANETNGTDKYQDAERGSSSGTESSGFSAPL